jgi:hypothetical protein
MTFQIESDIPMPKRTSVGRRGTEFPFADMEVGDSFLMPCDVSEEKNIVNWRRKLAAARKRFEAKSDYDIDLRTAVVADDDKGTGVRVWRTA